MTEGRQLDAVEDDVEEVSPEDVVARPQDAPETHDGASAGAVDDEVEAPTDEVEPAPGEVEDAPREDAPADDASADEAPADDGFAEEEPADEVPVDEAPADEVPADEVPDDDALADEVPADDVTPVDEAPADDDAPADEVPADDVTPMDEAPTDEVPADELPAELPAEGALSDDAVVDDAATEVEPATGGDGPDEDADDAASLATDESVTDPDEATPDEAAPAETSGPSDDVAAGDQAAPTVEPAPADEPAPAEESAPKGEASPPDAADTTTWTPRPWEAPTVVMNPVTGEPEVPAAEAPGVTRTSAMPARPSQTQPTAPAAASAAAAAAAVAVGPAAASTPAPAVQQASARTERPAPAGPDTSSTEPSPGRTSPMDVFPDQTHRRRWPRVLGLTAAAIVVLAGLYVGALWLWSDRVPTGTTVAGVEIGGLQAAEAEAQLQELLAAASSEPIPVTAGDVQATFDPTTGGLALDAEATVASVTGFDLQPVRLWHHLFGAGDVEPVTVVDQEALDAAVGDLAETLATPPVDGTIVFVDGQAQTTDAVDGAAVDEETAQAALVDGWLTAARPIELTTEVVEPAITQDEVDRTLAEVARPFVGAPVVVSVADQLAEIPVDVLAASASFVPEDDALVLQLDGALLVEAVTVRTTNLLTAPSDASFTFENGSPVIVPGVPGTTLDPDAVADAVAQAGTSPDRTARVELVETDPAESTAELEALGIVQVVSEFSTPLNSEPRRTTNIINGASKINGTLIRPGEVFSLTEALGPIDAAHGFVQAGAIVSGEHTDAWGGGLSQLSTTTYNAAFFAGYEDVEHHPHSEWFSRYPEGREATIFTGVLDMQWGNNTPYGALVQAWVDGGRVHVRIWSTPHWTVETSTSGRSNVVSPTTVYSQSPTCEAQSKGNPGFSVTVTRRILLQGVEQDTQSWTVRYKPQNQVICGPPPAETPPPTG